MIVDANDKVNIQSQGFGRSENMSIDTNSLQHIMTVLTNLYSDTETAVIREYSTNAYDSHVEAGKGDVPIEVRLPDTFEPIFRIRDYGVGLSEQEVYEIYGRYGASTKRESNAYVGQLGLGCKSALTLTDQFTLIAIKNGEKNTFNIHMDETGIPTISHAHRIATDEGNGVEVIVPVNNARTFLQKARSFYRFFPVTPNFVGSNLDLPENSVFMEFSDNVKLLQNLGHNTVVMGGVPYRADELFAGDLNYSGLKFLVYADVGEVNFTPSREELQYTKKTKDFLAGIEQLVRERIQEEIRNELDSCSTYYEAHAKFTSMDNQFIGFANKISGGKVLAEYKDIPIPLQFDNYINIYSGDYKGYFSKSTCANTVQLYGHHRYNKSKAVYLLRGNAQDFASNYKARLKKWAEDKNNGEVPRIIYLAPGVDLSDLTTHHKEIFGDLKELTYEKDLKPYKLSNGSTVARNSVKDLDFYRPLFGWRVDFREEPVDQSKKILAISRQDAYDLNKKPGAVTRLLVDNYNIYVVNKPLRKEFKKLYNPIWSATEAFEALADSLNKRLTDDIITSMFRTAYSAKKISRWNDLHDVADKEARELYKLIGYREADLSTVNASLKNDLNALHRVRYESSHLSNHALWHRVEEAKKATIARGEELETIVLDRYPFLSNYPDRDALKSLMNKLYNESEENNDI